MTALPNAVHLIENQVRFRPVRDHAVVRSLDASVSSLGTREPKRLLFRRGDKLGSGN